MHAVAEHLCFLVPNFWGDTLVLPYAPMNMKQLENNIIHCIVYLEYKVSSINTFYLIMTK